MANITIAPTPLDLTGVAGDPFALLLTVAVTDASGNPIPWSSVTSPVVEVVDYYLNTIPNTIPTLTSPTPGQWLLAWTPTQTAALGGQQIVNWALSATINGVGPLALVAGAVNMQPDTTPGMSTNSTAPLAVQVGTNNVAIAVTTTGIPFLGDEIDGGSAGSVYLSSQSIDGGFANSTYPSSQSIDGGNS